MDTTVIETEVKDLVEFAPGDMPIKSKLEADSVSDFLKRAKAIRKKIAAFFSPEVKKAHELHKALKAKMDEVDRIPREAEDLARELLNDWTTREARRVADEQRRLEEAEKAKVIQEAKKHGDMDLAKDIQSGQVVVESTVIAKAPEKIEGISTKQVWKVEVTSIREFLRGIVEQQGPHYDLIDVRLGDLQRLVAKHDGKIEIRGVKIWQETQIATR